MISLSSINVTIKIKERRAIMKDRYKDMADGEYIDGEFVAYEDMTEEQLMELEEQDIMERQRENQQGWYEQYMEEQQY